MSYEHSNMNVPSNITAATVDECHDDDFISANLERADKVFNHRMINTIVTNQRLILPWTENLNKHKRLLS